MGNNKKAVQLGFYPISITYVRSLISNCEVWEYDNKATCKYVAETIIEKIERETDLEITDKLYDELVSIVHNMNKGAKYLRIKIPYKIK